MHSPQLCMAVKESHCQTLHRCERISLLNGAVQYGLYALNCRISLAIDASRPWHTMFTLPRGDKRMRHYQVGLDLPGKITTGCVGFATKIVQRHFDDFIPRAIRCVCARVSVRVCACACACEYEYVACNRQLLLNSRSIQPMFFSSHRHPHSDFLTQHRC
jgi:hypothetical protein